MLLLSHILSAKVGSLLGSFCWLPFSFVDRVSLLQFKFLLNKIMWLCFGFELSCIKLELSIRLPWVTCYKNDIFLKNKVEGNQKCKWMHYGAHEGAVGRLDLWSCGPWEEMHLQVTMLLQRRELLAYMWMACIMHLYSSHLDNKLLHSTELWHGH